MKVKAKVKVFWPLSVLFCSNMCSSWKGSEGIESTWKMWLVSTSQSTKRARSGRKREKALSRLRSRPQPGRAEHKLWEIYKKISSISLWDREEKHHSTCRDLNPCPPPELPPGLPAPRRRSCRRRGGPCVASATLPFYLGSWKRGPNNLESATIRFVSDLLRAAPPDHLAMGRGKENGRAEREGRRPAGGLRISLDRGRWSLGSRWTEGCITPIKNLPSR